MEFIDGGDAVMVRASFDSEDSHSIGQQRDGWQSILNNFKRHVEAAIA